MPELPEVETIRRELEPFLCGKTIAQTISSGLPLRTPVPSNLPDLLRERKIKTLARAGKTLLFHFDNKSTLALHLGMSGRINLLQPSEWEAPAPHTHLRVQGREGWEMRFIDPRRFGRIDFFQNAEEARHSHLGKLGVDPTEEIFTETHLAQLLEKRAKPVKNLLLDQEVIAGLGNIYVSEALFRAGIHPQRAARDLKPKEISRLRDAIREVLAEAIHHKGSTLKDHRQANGEKGGFQDFHQVYGREGMPCAVCLAKNRTSLIVLLRQSGRSGFFCPQCQPKNGTSGS